MKPVEVHRQVSDAAGPESRGQAQGPLRGDDMAEPAIAIELKGISKAFGPVQANKDIDPPCRRGTIHGIIGENGAGKSTLMSILYGFYKADAGQIFIDGKP
jgi:general nucleoside transport system ATP-binding protein